MARPRKTSRPKSSKELEEIRKDKRERNKLAAARCRQRMRDRTGALTKEAESEERKKKDLQAQINCLLKVKEELTARLSEHKSACLKFPKPGPDPSSACSETRKRPRPDSPAGDVASYKIMKKRRNDVVLDEKLDSAAMPSKPTSPAIGPDRSHCSDLSDISNDCSNSSRHGVMFDEKLDPPVKASRPKFLAIGPSNSPCPEFSDISNDCSNSSRHDVMLDDKLDSVAKPRTPTQPTFLSIDSASSNSESNSSNNCEEREKKQPTWFALGLEKKSITLNFDSVINCESMMRGGTGLTPVDDPTKSFSSSLKIAEKLDSSAKTSRPTRPTFLAIGGVSSSNDSNSSSNCEKRDQNRPTRLDLGLKRKVEADYKTLETPTFIKEAPGSTELELELLLPRRITSRSSPLMIDKEVDCFVKPRTPTRPNFLAIGGVRSKNNNYQEQDQNLPTRMDLGSERKYITLNFDSVINCESIMRGGTGLTPVDDPMKSFCQLK